MNERIISWLVALFLVAVVGLYAAGAVAWLVAGLHLLNG